MSRISPALLPAAAVLALVLSACGGGADSSGLATLADTIPPTETVPESDQVETAGVVTPPPESTKASTETTTETTTEATAEATATTTSDAAGADDPPSVTADEPAPEPAPAEPGEDSTDADLSDEELLLRFADCMRENGVDFPDPVVEADGTVRFGFRPGAGGAGAAQDLARDPDLPAAREACEDVLEGLSFGPGSGNFDTTELQDTLLRFAQCMRDNGVDMSDPDLSNFGPGGNRDNGQGDGPFGGGIDFEDPDVAAALEVCQAEVNLGRFGRGGRGGRGANS